jgi:Ca-activated chloride channel family protein
MGIQAHFDRRLVPTEGTTERYLRIQVSAPDKQGPSTRLPLNLALVIDRSGSMEGTKLEKAKEAAIFCMRNLTGADRAAVVAYDDNIRVVAPSRPLTPEVKNGVISEIHTIRSGGSTNLAGGWLTGAQEVANHQHEANYLNRVILLSDGLANVGITSTEELAHHASELLRGGVSTTTMGIGADFNEDLMEQIAIKAGGHFYFIEHAKQIPDFLHRELGEVLSTCARRVALEVQLPAGVEARLLNNFETDRRTGEGETVVVRLDDMIAGETRAVVFKLAVRPGSLGARLPVGLKLSYVDAESGENREVCSEEAVLTNATRDEAESEEPNSNVLEDAALLEAALAREEALRYDAAGDYAGSAGRLAAAASMMQAMAPASPVAAAEAVKLREESQQAPEGFGAMKRKAMHYARSITQQSRKA